MSSLSDAAKKCAGAAAVEFVKDGMIVGLGTGSTAAHFIRSLAKQCEQGLSITAISSSKESEKLASSMGIKLGEIDDITSVDLTVDGADEIDSQKRMIKGGGGALLREKILASISKEVIIIVDSTKVVKNLGKFPLAVEIVPFAFRATIFKLANLGFKGAMRKNKDSTLFVTDNKNFIYDISFETPPASPEWVHQVISEVPGVVETGFFFNLVQKVIVGYPDETVKIIEEEVKDGNV